MEISCTKELADKLGVKLEPRESRTPFFDWHAWVISVNRRKMLVLLNNETHFVVTVYGLRGSDWKRFSEIVRYVIRDALIHFGCTDGEISLYLGCLGEMHYAKTERKLNASMVHVVEAIKWYSQPLSEGFSQPELDDWLNQMPVSSETKWLFPNEEFRASMDRLSAGTITTVTNPAIVFSIFLPLGESGAERVVAVSPDMTFRQFHRIIQRCFEWQDYHMHEFEVMNGGDLVARVVMPGDDEDFGEPEQRFYDRRMEKIKLSTYFPKYRQMNYTYDFGDDWLHQITLEQYIEDYSGNLPALLSGSGDAPPEDVGGEYGFVDFQDIICDKNNPECDEMLEWAKSLGWQPFDLERVRRRVK